jgi:uncharacterized membrane protein YphA (DoxX/SURF4 family)
LTPYQGFQTETSGKQFGAIHIIARIALVLIFAYHGQVPKLIVRHPDEITMLRDAGVPEGRLSCVLTIFGVGELFLALCLLLFSRHRWAAVSCIGLMCAGMLGVAVSSPRFLTAAFNPVSLNFAVASLAIIDVIALSHRQRTR